MSNKITRLLPASAPGAIEEAAACLRADGLVAFPTETVYGLGADATSGMAVSGIYAAKGRPAFNPLIAHVESLEAALVQGIFSPEALVLAHAFWPGPLTLVVPFHGQVCDLARAGLPSLGLRVPASPVARALIAAAGRPVAGPSANRSGHVSPVTAQHVLDDLDGRIDIILDDGPCPVGVESTIVACSQGPPRLLRPGGIALEAIELALGTKLDTIVVGTIVAPGQMASHYAPRARLRLNASSVQEGEVGLDFAGHLRAQASIPCALLDLSRSGNLSEAAANLFNHLRRLDKIGASHAAVAPVPMIGLGVAINDRLSRAAAR